MNELDCHGPQHKSQYCRYDECSCLVMRRSILDHFEKGRRSGENGIIALSTVEVF